MARRLGAGLHQLFLRVDRLSVKPAPTVLLKMLQEVSFLDNHNIFLFICCGLLWQYPVSSLEINLLNLMTHQSFRQSLPQISVEQLAKRMEESPEGLQLIDVREEQEVAIAHLEGFENLPLSEFAEWSDQIPTRFDPEAETLVLCHHGVRSAQMCQWLVSQGFTNVKNITGGIDAYSLMVDRSIPQY